MSIAMVSCHYAVNELAIDFITKNYNNVTQSIQMSAPSSAKFLA
jgi:hypothetical protein